MISDTPIQDKFKNGQVSRRYVCKFVKRHSTAQVGPLFTEFPQTMTPWRAEWTTFANIKDWYDISAQTMLDTPNQIAVTNPAWDKASVVEQESGEIDRLFIRRTDCMGSLDEMPLSLNVSTGQKSKSDKKISAYVVDVAEMHVSA